MRIFEDSWRRIARAREHLESFVTEWNSFQLSEKLRIRVSVADDFSSGIVRAVLPSSIQTNKLAIILGEFFYQLRAALDCAIYTLAVILEGCDPPANASKLYFPIYTSPKEFKNSGFFTGPFPESMKQWLEDLQLYKSTATTGTSLSDVNRILDLIHTCAKNDRHRHLHVVAAVPTNQEFKFYLSPESVRITDLHPIQSDLLVGDSELLHFRIEGADEALRIGVETKLSAEVSIEGVILNGADVTVADEMYRMMSETDRIIQTFEEFTRRLAGATEFTGRVAQV